MNIFVIGAGAWGTALALSAARAAPGRHLVTLWARDAAQAAAMQRDACNARYLPGVALPPTLHIASGPLSERAADLAQQDLLVIASPMAGLRAMLTQLRHSAIPVVWLCKGIESSTGALPHEIAAEELHRHQAAVLSGPSWPSVRRPAASSPTS